MCGYPGSSQWWCQLVLPTMPLPTQTARCTSREEKAGTQKEMIKAWTGLWCWKGPLYVERCSQFEYCCDVIHSTSSLWWGASFRWTLLQFSNKMTTVNVHQVQEEKVEYMSHILTCGIQFSFYKFIEDFKPWITTQSIGLPNLGWRLSVWQCAAPREEIFLMIVLLWCWHEIHMVLHQDSCCYEVYCWTGKCKECLVAKMSLFNEGMVWPITDLVRYYCQSF